MNCMTSVLLQTIKLYTKALNYHLTTMYPWLLNYCYVYDCSVYHDEVIMI